MADKFGLRAWTINLRAWIFGFACLVFKTTYIDRRIPLREGAFPFTRTMLFFGWIRGILAIRRRVCVSLRRGISGRDLGDEERGRRGVMVAGEAKGRRLRTFGGRNDLHIYDTYR